MQKKRDLKQYASQKKNDDIVYKRFSVADKMIHVENYTELLVHNIQEQLIAENTILVSHGSFNAYIGTKDIIEKLSDPMFGNISLLNWETNRSMQRKWLQMAGLKLSEIIKSPEEIQNLVIVKLPGARGGKGYFIADSKDIFFKKWHDMTQNKHLKGKDIDNVHIQEYIIGVNVYPSYFHSILENEVELSGIDKRYESTADNIGRIPADEQLRVGVNPNYIIVGNIPITIRESLLPQFLMMGDDMVKISKKIAPPVIIDLFCLVTVVTEHLDIVTFEISARIVAGTNVGIGNSFYSYLKYGNGMYMGRRIAREIKNVIQLERLEEILT